MARGNRLVPDELRAELREIVAGRAKEHGYAARSRPQNHAFLNGLADDPDVGQRLVPFLEPSRVRGYIKDTLLKPAAKAATEQLCDVDPAIVLRSATGRDGILVNVRDGLTLHRLGADSVAVVARASLSKWESSLRRAAEYLVGLPGIDDVHGAKHIVLCIAVEFGAVTDADRRHIAKALALLGASAVFSDQLGEG